VAGRPDACTVGMTVGSGNVQDIRRAGEDRYSKRRKSDTSAEASQPIANLRTYPSQTPDIIDVYSPGRGPDTRSPYTGSEGCSAWAFRGSWTGQIAVASPFGG
jgi:hypothetical protein